MKATGKFSYTTTRDIKILKGEFPAKEMQFDFNFEITEKYSQNTEERCAQCGQFVVSLDEVPNCRGCVTGSGPHAKNATCRRLWCMCPQEEPRDADDHEVEGDINESSRALLVPRKEAVFEDAPEAPPSRLRLSRLLTLPNSTPGRRLRCQGGPPLTGAARDARARVRPPLHDSTTRSATSHHSS